MSKYNVGDKFEIEIEEILTGECGSTLYRIKGFKSLVIDDYGLGKLENIRENEENFEIGDVAKVLEGDYKDGIYIVFTCTDYLVGVLTPKGIIYFKKDLLKKVRYVLCDD